MKAIILAAGKGERLKEITQSIPKPMIQFKGKPVLQYNIESCKKYGINEIFINLHHLPEKITEYFGNGEKFDVDIKYSFEEKLLGTAGAVRKIAKELWNFNSYIAPPIHDSIIPNPPNSSSPNHHVSKSLSPKSPKSATFQHSDPFFVIYGDNYSNFNLHSLIKKSDATNSLAIIGFHYMEDVTSSGVAEFNHNNKIQRFIEKPKKDETESHWVNAGIYYLSPKILEFIPDGFSDFGKDIFPLLIKKNFALYGVCEKSGVLAFDTPELYNKNIVQV